MLSPWALELAGKFQRIWTQRPKLPTCHYFQAARVDQSRTISPTKAGNDRQCSVMSVYMYTYITTSLTLLLAVAACVTRPPDARLLRHAVSGIVVHAASRWPAAAPYVAARAAAQSELMHTAAVCMHRTHGPFESFESCSDIAC